jgi:hypothetical protein
LMDSPEQEESSSWEAMREGRYSGPTYEVLAESTIRGAVSYVASTFRDNARSNPTCDEDGELGCL